MMTSTTSVPIPVVVLGAAGRMGRAVVATLLEHPQDFTLVGAFDRNHITQPAAQLVGLSTDVCQVVVSDDLPAVLTGAQLAANGRPFVVVDFTVGDSVKQHLETILHAGGRPVIGATGFQPQDLAWMDSLLKSAQLPGALIPNFSIGAVLLMQFAQQASRYFEHAELIEYHHNQKLDAPSGTSVRTADLMAEARAQFATTNVQDHETIPGARGAAFPTGLRVHSVRLPGLVAHQEVIFGAPGEMLTVRHDSFDRKCFMPGVRLVAQKIAQSAASGLTVGLEYYL